MNLPDTPSVIKSAQRPCRNPRRERAAAGAKRARKGVCGFRSWEKPGGARVLAAAGRLRYVSAGRVRRREERARALWAAQGGGAAAEAGLAGGGGDSAAEGGAAAADGGAAAAAVTRWRSGGWRCAAQCADAACGGCPPAGGAAGPFKLRGTPGR